MAVSNWTVIVGNIGTVFDGINGAEATRVYGQYKAQSMIGSGRAAGEPVTLMRDGEPFHKYAGNSENED